tara:strand:- start:2348 stop:2632 length:285 start_codon:yes stop_codon:yes gene_type:complete
MIIIIILLIIVLIFVSYLLYLSLKKINQYEEFILQISKIIEFATEKMKQVDASGHYESDDETGFFFEQMKQIQNILNDLFETPGDEIDAEKEKK